MSVLPPPSYEESQRQDEVDAGKDQYIAMIFFIDLQDIRRLWDISVLNLPQ